MPNDLVEVLSQRRQNPHEEKSSWGSWFWKKTKQISYMAGAGLVSLSCLGYMADPPALLQSYGWSKKESYIVSAPALYFFGVLLGHLGGVTAETDFISITRSVVGKGSMPLAAKLHTKTFCVALIVNLYTALFSYKAAEKIAADHFGESGWGAHFIKWCADFGIAYLSWGSMKTFYDYYLIQGVRLNSKDHNHLIAEYRERIADFKRRISSIDTDQLVASLKQMPQKELTLGMSEIEFDHKTQFNERFEEMLKTRNRSWSEWWGSRGSIYPKAQKSSATTRSFSVSISSVN